MHNSRISKFSKLVYFSIIRGNTTWKNQYGGIFQKDVIIVTVGYYLRYTLSHRKVQETLHD